MSLRILVASSLVSVWLVALMSGLALGGWIHLLLLAAVGIAWSIALRARRLDLAEAQLAAEPQSAEALARADADTIGSEG